MYNANQEEQKILDYWDEHGVFEKSVAARPEKNPYHFYDGPPFATGLPHYGHIVASLMKDAVPRYWTMRGKRVERRWGWDCHGLPVENIIEKDLNLNSKKDIEAYGVAKFNEACRATVLKYAGEWKKTVRRMGRWVDMENDYKTMDLSYMESVWWVFRQLWDMGLVYKGHKAMHICPRCVTPLSNFEVTQGYKDVKDISVTAKFKILGDKLKKSFNTTGDFYILAWTTTPWTLPGNVLLAVGEEIEYLVCTTEELNTFFVVAKERAEAVMKDKKYKVERIIKGLDLIGLEYEPLFPYFADTPNAFRVVAGDFVTTADGTGVVHIAPAFGEDDYNLGKREGLPLVQHVTMEGKFIPAVKDFVGREVKPKEDPTATDVEILKWLAANHKLFSKESFTHSYPHCWRCDTPLLNYATDCWFIKVTELKELLLQNNEKIRWVPENFKAGRFGEWLSGVRDWAVSRNRYWGNPLPVWENADGETLCMGSVKELAELSGKKLTKIIFVRHGESEVNISKVKSSEQDKYPLTKQGVKEVEDLAGGFTEKVDIIISSPVLRAKQTAEIFQKKLKVDLIFDDLLSEYHYGSWEGKSKDELLKQTNYQRYKEISASLEDKYNFQLGGDGESRAQITERVRKFLDKLVKEHGGKTILIPSHGGINACMNMVLRGVDYDKFFSEERIGYQGLQYFYLDENGKEMDIHKHLVDKIEIKKDGKVYRRVPEVLDCWFESGSMPYGQMHYPFENRKKFESSFPAEFIAEGQDQTRGWFYTLHVLATALTMGKKPAIPVKRTEPAFKNVIVNGIVLAEDGKKMSKRLKNYPEPDLVLEKYGADAMRYYLVTSPVMAAESLNFCESGVREVYNKLVNTLSNVFEFYRMYAGEVAITTRQPAGKDTDSSSVRRRTQNDSKNVLDKWILAKLNLLIKDVAAGMENYELVAASRPVGEFVTELSQWYVRRSRERFKGDDEKDKQAAVATLREVLFTLSKVMAPFTPFIAEKIYLELGGEKESVHLEEWPQADKKMIGEKILTQMNLARKIVEMGLALRSETGIKVKQPLAKLTINSKRLDAELLAIIADELNVKEVVAGGVKESEAMKVKQDGELSVGLDIVITPALKKEGAAREIVRAINQIRKDQKLTVSDRVKVVYQTDSVFLKEVMKELGAEIKKSVLADELRAGAAGAGTVEAGGEPIALSVEK